jgi:hypothetical protein
MRRSQRKQASTPSSPQDATVTPIIQRALKVLEFPDRYDLDLRHDDLEEYLPPMLALCEQSTVNCEHGSNFQLCIQPDPACTFRRRYLHTNIPAETAHLFGAFSLQLPPSETPAVKDHNWDIRLRTNIAVVEEAIRYRAHRWQKTFPQPTADEAVWRTSLDKKEVSDVRRYAKSVLQQNNAWEMQGNNLEHLIETLQETRR